MNDVPATPDPDTGLAEPGPPRPVHAGLRFLTFLMLLLGGGFLLTYAYKALHLPRPFTDGVAQPIGTFGISLVAIIAGLLATWIPLRWMERRGLDTVGLAPRRSAIPRLALGFVGGGLTPVLVFLAFAATGIASFHLTAPNLLVETLPMAAGLFVISCWEEIALRGYFLQVVGEMSRPWIAAVASGTIFGLIHAGNPGANPAGLILTGVNGILLSFLVIRTGSLWLACGYHAGWNVIAAIFLGMRDSGMVHRGALAATDLAGPAFLTGGDYGFEGSWVTGGVEAVVLTVLLLLGPRLANEPAAREFYRRARTATFGVKP
jgi:membrane protease YdiL (CAAX protease family)